MKEKRGEMRDEALGMSEKRGEEGDEMRWDEMR